MITKKLETAINDQITAELWSSNLYLQMAFYLEKEGWDGFAHWMYKQAEEEKEHALDMAHYLMKRGGEAKVAMIIRLPSACEKRLIKLCPTDRSLRENPGRSELVESASRANTPRLPYSVKEARSIVSSVTGVKSILKSPV